MATVTESKTDFVVKVYRRLSVVYSGITRASFFFRTAIRGLPSNIDKRNFFKTPYRVLYSLPTV